VKTTPFGATLALVSLTFGALIVGHASRQASEPEAAANLTVGVPADPFSRPAADSHESTTAPQRQDGEMRPSRGKGDHRIDSSFSEQEILAFQAEALLLPPSDGISGPGTGEGVEFSLGTNFDSLDITECCQTGTLNPPDPELAVGPNHIIAVVNSSLEIYDKSGSSLVGPQPFEVFFAALGGGCTSFPFDPNVLYDESADRFIIAADGDGVSYCVGVTQTGDPTGSYFLYSFPVNVNGDFFDYPHAGVGVDAIYVGANMFGGGVTGRVFAFDKVAMYAGGAAQSADVSLGSSGTPQPMNVHGTFPASGPHYILTSRSGTSNPSLFGLFSWDDPFGASSLDDLTTFNLPTVHGVTVGFPISNPPMGGANITGFNPRPLDFEYRDGSGWFTNGVSCNPGGGTRNCIQWAEVDVATASVLDAGVFADSTFYRFLPDLGVNACGDMIVGYSRSNAASFAGVQAAGRKAGDPAGTLQGEVQVEAGEVPFGGTDRWGDYTGMTIDPDGTTFWYLGEYSKNNGNSRNWGTYIGALSFPDCASELIFTDGFESGNTSAWTTTIP